MLMFKIALRNIFRQRRRSLLTGLMMAGSYILLSASLGLSEGSYDNIINLFTRDHTGHVQIHKGDFVDRPNLYKTIEDPDTLLESVTSRDKVIAASPRIKGSALAFASEKTAPAQLIGLSPDHESRVTSLKQKVKSGRLFNPSPNAEGYFESLIGASLANLLKLTPGDEIVLISQGADGSIANDQFIVSGIIGTEDSYERMNVYLPLHAAQQFLVLGDQVHEIALVLEDYEDAQEVATTLNQSLPEGLTASPWQRVEEEFYRTMNADKKGNYVTLAVVMIIVAIGVLNTVLMTLLERTKEYGILKAIGTHPGFLFRLILLETTALAFLSCLVGLAPAFLLNYWLANSGIQMDTPVEIGGIMFDRILGEVSAASLLIPAIVTIGTALLVSFIPAIKAARVEPVDALRSY